MIIAPAGVEILRDQPLETWFGIGGGASRLARPETIEQLRECARIDPNLRVMGDGANLLVDDEGVGELVVELKQGEFVRVHRDERTGLTIAGAGASLPKLIVESVRMGLGGVEGLGGIPATLGGAVVMNAGGAFGQIADVVARVHGIERDGREVVRDREEIDFSYRHSGLEGLIVTKVELDLKPGDPGVLRERLKDVMEYKSRSQPMSERSAGCCFKNPILRRDLEGIGATGARVSAGMLIDKAACKGVSVGGASVSERHANFIVAEAGKAKARDVIGLMDEVARRVHEAFGVALEREVVVWGQGPQ